MNYDKVLMFDPLQLPLAGGEFIERETFAYRYIKYNKFFFLNSIYIPLGPIIKTEDGILDFIVDIENRFRFCKVILDLPMFYDTKTGESLINELERRKFVLRDYIQDEEDIVIKKENFIDIDKIDRKVRSYINKGRKISQVYHYTNPTKDIINKVYPLYIENSKNKNFKPKSIDFFYSIASNSLLSISESIEDSSILAFLYSYIHTFDSKKYSYAMFSAVNDFCKKYRLNYDLRISHIKYFFTEIKGYMYYNHGASRTRNRGYTEFKSHFCKNFVSYPGSYEKFIF